MHGLATGPGATSLIPIIRMGGSAADPLSHKDVLLVLSPRTPQDQETSRCQVIRYPLTRSHLIADRSRRFPFVLEFNKWGTLGKVTYHPLHIGVPLPTVKSLIHPTIHARASDLN